MYKLMVEKFPCMKKLALGMTFLLALVGFSSGAYERPPYYDCVEAKLCIYPGMDHENVSNDPVKNSGRGWNGTMEIKNASYQKNISERIENVTFKQINSSKTILTFDGIFRVKSECHYPDYNVNYSSGQIYGMELYGDKSDDWSCVRRPTRINYTMKLETSPDFRINIDYNNQTTTLETENFKLAGGVPEDLQGGEDGREASREDIGFLTGIINFFSGLF